MNNPYRPCWQNCGVEADAEMLEIDAMEDAIAPLDKQTTRIRELMHIIDISQPNPQGS